MSNTALLCCVFIWLLQDCTRVATAVESSGPRVGCHRALLHQASKWRRGLLNTSSGSGLWVLPSSALSANANGPLTFMSTDSEGPSIENKSGCPAGSGLIAMGSIKRGTRTPVCTSGDGSVLIWGNSAASAAPPNSGRAGTVYFLDDVGSCSYSYSIKLPNPVVLLPVNYQFRLNTDTGAPMLSHIAASGTADVILVATAQSATFTPPNGNTIVRENATPLPYTLTALSYKRILKPNTTRYTYIPANILPIPAMASQNGRVSGLSLSADGRTALVCLMPRCGSKNPSSCGAGAAHVFRLTTDATSRNMNVLGGHQWTLVATLPFQGYGTAAGHGVACSLSQDGATAAVLTGAVVTETPPVPITANSSTGNSSSNPYNTASSSNRRMQQVQTNSNASSGSTAAPLRRAYMQLYAASSPGGPWAAVGSDLLDLVVADCITGTSPCRPVVAVTERFAAVAYRSGSDVKVEVVYHTAGQAAGTGKGCEFTKICLLSKSLGRQQAGMNAVPPSDLSADLIAGVTVHQPPGTLSLKVQVTTRSPGAVYLWTLSRREDRTCPTTAKNLLEASGLNPAFSDLPQLVTDTTADGSMVVFTGVPGGDGGNVFGVLGSF